MFKSVLFFLSIPLIGFSSTYDEVTPLPSECYPTNNYFPDMITVVPKCLAVSDFQASRPKKSIKMFFNVYYKNCSKVSESSPEDIRDACTQSYLTYFFFYDKINDYTKKNLVIT